MRKNLNLTKIERSRLIRLAKKCRQTVLKMHKEAQAGHIGAAFSCLDILVYLYFQQMEKRDRFILSKGHAATALYAVLAQAGIISKKDLKTFHQDGTHLAAHPPCSGEVAGITFGTGSLGHGLSLATGLALSTRFSKKKFQVYCLISEGDINEGSTWEAILFAAQHQLNNLTVIVDYNGLQAFGRSEEVLSLHPLADKWRAFNFDVFEVLDGHDFNQLHRAFIASELNSSDRPKCIIAKTVKGKGISYMEDKLEWHYLSMDDDQFKEASKQIKESNA